MNRLDRYLTRAVMSASALALAVLVALNAIYAFIDEQRSVGEGTYTIAVAARVVALSIPQQLFELMPFAALLGSILGLGELARRSEIVAMRAAGVSVARLALALSGCGLVGVLIAAFIGEYVAPHTTQIALRMRAEARMGNNAIIQGTRFWVHEGRQYISVDATSVRHGSPKVTVFEGLPEQDALASIGRTASAQITQGDVWLLQQYQQWLYGAGGVRQISTPSFSLYVKSGAALLDATSDPSDRSIEELASLVSSFRANHQDARVFTFALWARVARTLSTFWCVLLALPFAFGNLRTAGSGVRFIIAAAIGIAYIFGQQVVESGAVLSRLDPVVLAWLPTLVLAVLTTVLLLRAR